MSVILSFLRELEPHGTRMVIEAAVLDDQEHGAAIATIVMRMERNRRRNRRCPR